MSKGRFPRIEIVDETPREGMQIESSLISTADKIALIDGLSEAGVPTIVVGSFVSPKWVPQMSDIEDVVAGFTPRDGVTYRALALNQRGRERREHFMPPLSTLPDVDRYMTRAHLCDVFVRRNVNRSQASEIEAWEPTLRRAVDAGATAAAIGVNAAWGSNWQGEFSTEDRMGLLRPQYELWEQAGVAVTKAWIGDPMGWNMPHQITEQLSTILEEWPSIDTFHLHLHNTRGMAMLSAYAAMQVLDERHTLILDATVGGIGGCPYCGNGRATGMIPTEDLVHFLENSGVDTGIDLERLIAVSVRLQQVIGRSLDSHVARAGARPHGNDRYVLDMPLIETLDEAQHFRVGPRAYANRPRPWKPDSPLFELAGDYPMGSD